MGMRMGILRGNTGQTEDQGLWKQSAPGRERPCEASVFCISSAMANALWNTTLVPKLRDWLLLLLTSRDQPIHIHIICVYIYIYTHTYLCIHNSTYIYESRQHNGNTKLCLNHHLGHHQSPRRYPRAPSSAGRSALASPGSSTPRALSRSQTSPRARSGGRHIKMRREFGGTPVCIIINTSSNNTIIYCVVLYDIT